LDILGALLMVTATVTLMFALSWGGHRFSWTSPQVLGLIVCSLALWTMFVIRLHAAAEPLIPLAVLRNPVVRAGTLASCFSMGTFIGLTIYVPVYFEAVIRMSASESGFALVPLMVGTVAGATFSGRAMAHVEHYKRVPLAGLVISMIASLVVIFFAASLPLPLLELALAAISIGLGTVLPVSTVAIQNAVLPHQLGTVTATMNFFRQLGGALIVAVFGAIVLGSATADDARLTLDTLAGAVSSGAELTSAFQWVFAAAFLGFAAAFVSLLAMEEKPLRGTSPGVGDR
jgi:predicted MFS family arabinose efflux permease